MSRTSNLRSHDRTFATRLGLPLLLALAATAQACSNECDAKCDPSACIDGKCASGPAPDAGAPDADVSDANSQLTVTRLTITPTSAALLSRDGAQPTVAFSVVAEWSDGRNEPVAAPGYTVTPPELGSVADNVFTANGRVGGEGQVRAEWRGVSATAVVRIRLEQTILVGKTSTTVPPLFE